MQARGSLVHLEPLGYLDLEEAPGPQPHKMSLWFMLPLFFHTSSNPLFDSLHFDGGRLDGAIQYAVFQKKIHFRLFTGVSI